MYLSELWMGLWAKGLRRRQPKLIFVGPLGVKKSISLAFSHESRSLLPGSSGTVVAIFSKSPGVPKRLKTRHETKQRLVNISNFYLQNTTKTIRGFLKWRIRHRRRRFNTKMVIHVWMILLVPPWLWRSQKNSPWPKHQWSPAMSGDRFRPSDVRGWGSRSELHPRSCCTWLHLLRSSQFDTKVTRDSLANQHSREN